MTSPKNAIYEGSHFFNGSPPCKAPCREYLLFSIQCPSSRFPTVVHQSNIVCPPLSAQRTMRCPTIHSEKSSILVPPAQIVNRPTCNSHDTRRNETSREDRKHHAAVAFEKMKRPKQYYAVSAPAMRKWVCFSSTKMTVMERRKILSVPLTTKKRLMTVESKRSNTHTSLQEYAQKNIKRSNVIP